MTELSLDDARKLIRTFDEFTTMIARAVPESTATVTARMRAHFGTDSVSNIAASFDPIERANLQLAFDHLVAGGAPWETLGLSNDIGQFGVSINSFLSERWSGPDVSAPQYISAQTSATETIRCLRNGIVLTRFGDEPIAVLVQLVERTCVELQVEVAALSQDAADGFLQHLQALMAEHNVLRGKVIGFTYSEYGSFGLTFTAVPAVRRSEVILPRWKLEAIEDHAFGITSLRDELVAAGQHLKRGLLLYGPPGTGKTHTVSYLVGQMANRTTIILSGASVGAVGQAGTMARKLAPATIVIEDVDLIGLDRDLPGADHNPLLFQLLNEMDGLHDDDDVLFVLTTNRADMLEPALAARPGRIDQAIEISLPDDEGRRALFRLYLGTGVILDSALDSAVERTNGVTAAFIKELARRATVKSLRTGDPLGQAVAQAIDDIAATATPVLRASLTGVVNRRQRRPPDLASLDNFDDGSNDFDDFPNGEDIDD